MLNTYPSLQSSSHKEKMRLKRFYLGDPYQDVYLTAREASCMWQFLNHKTISETAKSLNLSPRTVEFYTNNMKAKLACYSKAELIQRVLKSKFIKNYIFEKQETSSLDLM